MQKEFKDYLNVAKRVKAIVQDIDLSAQVYLFGSTVKNKATAISDIDILVVTEMLERKYDIMVKVYKALKEPLELHVINKAMFDGWYRRFISKEELIEI
ncbi:MAG: nucleotidyltransferase domain-containing protein [Candidatus Bathyarchaeia archaeon]|nr:nucleotidyltransferase domain-containing protein [Candidatus Bathyarchaeota archaeon]